MKDSFGREIEYMRVSVTDRCNLRCVYCMPKGVKTIPAREILTFEEIRDICSAAASLGIKYIRLTGGEPLVRLGVERLVEMIKAVDGIEGLTLTTNGVLLEEKLPGLVRAGLDGVNISLDTLDRELFRRITGFDRLDDVKKGIKAALDSGVKVKLNTVIMEENRNQKTDSYGEVHRPDTVEHTKAAIEAVLFAMGDSLELSKIAKAIGHDTETTRKVLQNMMDDYQKEDRGIRIIELENAYQLCTKQEYYEYLVNIALQPKKAVLSDVMMETLSIIAYKQPVTKIEIEKIRGVKSDHAVNKLIEYNLVQEVGRLDAPGRPILLGTTEEFLRNFGVDSTDNLPTINPVKLEDFKAEAEEEIQIRLDI